MGEPFDAIVGAANTAPGESETVDGVRVEAVVRPGSAEQVAACMVVAREGKRLLLAGGRTKLHWGNPPQADALTLLELARLDAPPQIDADEGIVTVAAGVRVDALADALAAHGKRTLMEPLHPGATVGGTLAADPVGPEYSLDRRLRGDVLGLEVALPNGEVTRSGGRVVKNVTGFDLVRLYCGSLGTLGAITEATLRLRALPESRRVVASEHADVADALRGLTDAVAPAGQALLPASGGVRQLRLYEGSERVTAAAARDSGGDEVDNASWSGLDAAVLGADDVSPIESQIRLSARPSDTAALCRAVGELGGVWRLALPLAGVVFANVPETALDRLFAFAQHSDWALFIERATAAAKVRFDVFGPTLGTLALMHALKTRFDSGAVLAPGRFVGRL